MSTYAVFGMTRPRAIDMARKSVAGCLVEAEWDTQVGLKVDEIMGSSRCVMLSDKYDAPQFAREYLELAKRIDSRDLHIKSQTKTGDFTKKGTPKTTWTRVIQ